MPGLYGQTNVVAKSGCCTGTREMRGRSRAPGSARPWGHGRPGVGPKALSCQAAFGFVTGILKVPFGAVSVMPRFAPTVFALMLLMVVAFAGCMDAERGRADDGAAGIGTPADTGDDVMVGDHGLARIVDQQSFEGRFASDERTSHTVASISGVPAELRFPVIEAPRPGVPATVELTLRYDRTDPVPVFTAPIQLDVDVALPPFVFAESEDEGGGVRTTFTIATDGPVNAVVRHAAPNPTNQEAVEFTLDVKVTWHLDAVPAGVPIALHVDPDDGLPELRPLAKRLSYVLFDPAGQLVGIFPVDEPLPLDDQAAGTYRLALLDAPAAAPPGVPLFQIVSASAHAPRALAWERHVLGSTPLGPTGETTAGFDVPHPLWGMSLEVVGTHTWANGYEWTVRAGDTVVMDGGCDACSGSTGSIVLGAETAADADLMPGPHGLDASGLYGDAGLVVAGYVPAAGTA